MLDTENIKWEIYLFTYLAVLHGFWDLSSPTSDRTWAPAVKVQNPNHWTAREFLGILFKLW